MNSRINENPLDASLNSSWVVVIASQDMESVARLWSVPDVQICEFEGEIWVRGDSLSENNALLVRTLPVKTRYALLEPNQLRPMGCRLPTRQLPQADWVPLRQYLEIATPTAGFPAQPTESLKLKLVADATYTQPNMILTTVATWTDFAISAPQVRLNRLAFASNGHDVVVRGLPMPTIPGQQYIEQHGVAIPAGLCFSPTLQPTVVAEMCGLQAGDVAVFHDDCSWDLIVSTEFVQASRSAARLTFAGPKLGEAPQ